MAKKVELESAIERLEKELDEYKSKANEQPTQALLDLATQNESLKTELRVKEQMIQTINQKAAEMRLETHSTVNDAKHQLETKEAINGSLNTTIAALKTQIKEMVLLRIMNRNQNWNFLFQKKWGWNQN